MKLKMLQRLVAFVILGGLVMWSCKDDEDTTPPEITLSGPVMMTLSLQGEFEEPGYIAEDDKDGDITSDVTVSEPDMNQAGEQEIVYSVSDAAQNVDTAIRHIEVINDSRGFAGEIHAEIVDPYPGTAPVKYADEITPSETENNVLTVANFGNSAGANVVIKLNHNPELDGEVTFVGTSDMTILDGWYSGNKIYVKYQKADDSIVELSLVKK